MSDDALFARRACAALVVTCSDFRFKSAERRFAEAAGLTDDYDLIARPGAIRSLVAPASAGARESLEGEITMLWALHRFTRVLMVNHLTCGAYGDLVSSGDGRDVHAAHLRAAAVAIEALVAGATAEAYLVGVVEGAAVVEEISIRG